MSLTAVLSHTLQCYRVGMAECGGQHLITREKLHTLECKTSYLFEGLKIRSSLHLLSFLEWGWEREKERWTVSFLAKDKGIRLSEQPRKA